MVDITHKPNTLRTATAQALVRVSLPKTMVAIREGRVPKGDVLAMGKAAGLLGVKKTADLLPDCHPIPIGSTDITYCLGNTEVEIQCTVKALYRTGVEVEAMHGASVVALTLYDMLKPIDPQVEIGAIRLLAKRGGRSTFSDRFDPPIAAAIVVCSDSVAAGRKEDTAGKAAAERLRSHGVEIAFYTIIPDEVEAIRQKAMEYSRQGVGLIIYVGGTGLSKRDVTPEALIPLLDRRIPGAEEVIRSYGQERMPYAMLSRSVAGMLGESLMLALPGSTRGAEESVDAIFPHLLHAFKVLKGSRHE